MLQHQIELGNGSTTRFPREVLQFDEVDFSSKNLQNKSRKKCRNQNNEKSFSNTRLLIITALFLLAGIFVFILLFLTFRARTTYSPIQTTLLDLKSLNPIEQFMRLYELFSSADSSFPHSNYNSLIQKVSQEHLKLASETGLLLFIKNATISLTKNSDLENNTNNITESNNKHLPQTANELIDSLSLHSNWLDDQNCKIECTKDDVTIPPLVVLSVDGFAREYLDRGLVPSLQKFSRCGSRSEFLFPSYPSKTFPNHYTIATGLYPESHGIVDNYLYDPRVSPHLEDVRSSKNHSGFYRGEPIWSALGRYSRRMFCLFWPGCSFNITGYNPAIDIKYDKSMPFSSRIDQIIEWLVLPADKRPSLIMAYFDQPDSTGHYHTSDLQVNLELVYLNSVFEYFFSLLHKNGLLDCVNLVLLSDHGMQTINKRFYFNDLVPNSDGLIFTSGPVSRIYVQKENSSSLVESIMSYLRCHDNSKFHLYNRKLIPKRYHYSRTDLIGDLIFDGRVGTTFFPTIFDDYQVTSDHGYDFLLRSMHAIFFSRGPNVKPQVHLQPIQNIELFNFFVDLLRLPHSVPNNGTRGVLDPILHNIEKGGGGLGSDSLAFNSMMIPIPYCQIVDKNKTMFEGCHDKEATKPHTNQTDICSKKVALLNQMIQNCSSSLEQQLSGLFHVTEDGSNNFCLISQCSTLISIKPSNFLTTRIIYENLNRKDFSNRKKRDISSNRDGICPIVMSRYGQTCNQTSAFLEAHSMKGSNLTLAWQGIMASDKNNLSEMTKCLLYKEFFDGPMKYLENITSLYVRKYSRLISITGTIYDENVDGLADETNDSRAAETNTAKPPTHIFRIIFRCEDGLWHINGLHCKKPDATRILTFVLPNQPDDPNCLKSEEYLLANSARVRDVELLTGVQFFSERTWFPVPLSIHWRVNITTNLWDV